MSGGDSLASDVYGHTVDLSSDGITDFYLVGGAITYSFPTGTALPVVYLTLAIQSNLLVSKGVTQEFILSRYSRDQQIQLLCMYLAAQSAGLTNRQTYIGQVLTWLNGIIGVFATYVGTVQSRTDPDSVFALSLDISKFPVDPGVTMLAAIQIPN